MKLRPYQAQLTSEVRAKWAAGYQNVVMVMATGGGKTPCIADLIAGNTGGSAAIVHRQELALQMSLVLARAGIHHNLIVSEIVRRQIVAAHIFWFKQSYFQPGSRVAVVSVDTLAGAKGIEWWLPQVTLWVVDEGHHVVEDNKWHTAIMRFTHPDVRGLLPTATPARADGKGLGRHADGVADAMVEGPPMRWLIDEGFLTDYDIYCPPSDLVMLKDVAASGDWSQKDLKEAAQRSHIIGDVVESYLAYAKGQRGISFMTDVETATATAARFKEAGVRAEVLHGKTDAGWRIQILKMLELGTLDQLVAVDIVSEGFDLPAVQVGSFGRPSQSFPLVSQQFGRLVRTMNAPGYDLETRDGRLWSIERGPKPRATVIDHAGNIIRHQGPPDKPRVWTLDRRDRKGGGGGIPLRACGAGWSKEALRAINRERGCYQPYEKDLTECPYCGLPTPPPGTPQERSSPAFVEGDLVQLDADTLARLRGSVEEATLPLTEFAEGLRAQGWTGKQYAGQVNHHEARLSALGSLQAAMGAHGFLLHSAGKSDREIQKAFWLTFGVDVLSAQALPRKDAETLTKRIWEYVQADTLLRA